MPTLPQFEFPAQEESGPPDSTITADIERPQIRLSTNLQVERYLLANSKKSSTRQNSLQTTSTPPESPTHQQPLAVGLPIPPKMYDNSAVTPPATPTRASHQKTGSASSDFLSTISSLRRGNSISSHVGRRSLDEPSSPSLTEVKVFPHHLTDYKYRTDDEGRKKLLGVGAWSDVYLARPIVQEPANEFAFHAPAGPALSPPLTPVQSSSSSTRKTSVSFVPSLYAIKVPGSTSAKKVLHTEARNLSYLSQFQCAEQHIAPFYGQDSRSGALVLKAMDGTLEDWIQAQLSALDEASRARTLAALFPSVALSLIDSLIWMQEKGCIHADIKPSNILVSSKTALDPHLVFSDFSSTIFTNDDANLDVPQPMGAGTWEYLDPSLLSFSNPAKPSHATDLWSLAITLLFLILGSSPFDAFKHNKFQQREMIKSGSPIQCLQYDDQGIQNMKILRKLSTDLGFDVAKWLGKVLVKNKDKRVDVEQWRDELISHIRERMTKA